MENRIIDNRLNVLRDKLLLLGGATETAVHNSMQSLIDRDSDLAQEVIDGDKVIDRMELEIDRLSIEILALQQPTAYDLRFVIAVAKITPILERIADHAANIAKTVKILNSEPQIKNYVDLPLMAQTAGKMLNTALDAFTSENSEVSCQIIKQDKEIDNCYNRVFKELIELMIKNPEVTSRAAHLLFVAKHLERIGDCVKDICELNVYLTEAVFIKHSKKK